MAKRWRRVRWALGGAVLAVLFTLLVLNLVSGEPAIEHRVPHLYAVGDEQFVRSMSQLLGPPLVRGNRVTAFQNGDEIFPAMLAAIRAAQRTVDFETYIYWSGRVGRDFADALSERARAGVTVHVMLDWVGSGRMDEALLDEMRSAGVEVAQYRPLHWYTLARLNNRTHRKLLVVDGRVGFTGGVGIADQWLGDARDSTQWRDSHYRVEGPAVAQLQAAFMDNWMATRERVLDGPEFFPPLDSAGPQLAQVFTSSAGDGALSVRLMYLLSIASATRSIRIANAYFLPDSLSVAMLVGAARRGVDVEIIVPNRHIDAALVRRASRARWGPLLEAGVAIHEFGPTMYHVKVMVVDDRWVSVGSTNFDSRSFELNDEANLNVLDSAFALEQVRVFEADKARSRRITLEQWQRRPWTEKAMERLAGLLGSQL